MSLIDRVLGRFARKESQARQLISLLQMGRPVSTPRNYAAFSDEGFSKNVVVFRCISMIATDCASIPWLLYKGKGARKTEIDEHAILDLLSAPNPLQAGDAFLQAVFAYWMISGNSYIESNGPGGKEIRELWPMRPDRVKIVPGSFGMPEAYLYSVGGNEKRFEVDAVKGVSPILHLQRFNPLNDWYGMSPMESALYGVDQHNEAGKWNLSLLQNGARPSGALVATVTDKNPGGKLGDQQYARLKADIEERYTGSRNAGRPMLLEGGLDWKEMSLSPKEMDWIEGKHTSARDIALAFGVPPQLLGIPGDNTYANYAEARLAFYEQTVLPLRKSFRAELNRWLVPAFDEKLSLDDDLDSVDAMAPKREATWNRINTAAHLTVNEKREATGYEHLDEGDVVLVSATMTTLESLTMAASEPDADDQGDQEDQGDPADPEDQADGGSDEDTEADAPAKSEPRALESKVFNLLTHDQKVRESKAVERLRATAIKKLHTQLHAVFKVEGEHVKAAVEGLHEDAAKIAAVHAISGQKSQIRTVLSNNLKGIMLTFGGRVTQAMKSDGLHFETKEASVRFQRFYQDWINSHLDNLVDDLEETTRDVILGKIREAFEESQSAGESVTDLASKLDDIYSKWSDSRAMLIARTETTTASNAASLGAAKAVGIPGLRKEWIFTNDERTREDHRLEEGGAVVDINEKFMVGGNEMDMPGDPSAPADEICNCRCTIGYLRPESGQGDQE